MISQIKRRGPWGGRWSIVLPVLMTALCPSAMALTSCSVSSTALAFGIYNPLSASANTSTATVTVNCTVTLGLLANWTVSLSAGASGTALARTLISGGSTLPYQVYTDATHTQIWGDGLQGTGVNSGSFFALLFGATTATYTLYGSMPARQMSVSSGTYVDTLIVTITY